MEAAPWRHRRSLYPDGVGFIPYPLAEVDGLQYGASVQRKCCADGVILVAVDKFVNTSLTFTWMQQAKRSAKYFAF
jgi:hypothetical protein